MMIIFVFLFVGLSGVTSDHLLLSADFKLILVDLLTKKADIYEVEQKTSWMPNSLAYHYSKGYLFYAAHNHRETNTTVHRISIPFKAGEKPLDIQVDGKVDEIAIDWLQNRIYYLNSSAAELYTSDLDGNNRRKLIDREKVKKALLPSIPKLAENVKLENLVVDPFERTLFFFAYDPSIQRHYIINSDLRGNTLRLQFIRMPSFPKMKLNIQQKLLFMYHTQDFGITVLPYRSSGIVYEKMLQIYYQLSDRFTVVGSDLYWLNPWRRPDKEVQDIYKIYLPAGVTSKETVYSVEAEYVTTMQIFDQRVQTIGSHASVLQATCNITGCSHGCKILGIGTCDCPNCYHLGRDQVTCEVDPDCGEQCFVPDGFNDNIFSYPNSTRTTLPPGAAVGDSQLITITCPPGLLLVPNLVTKAFSVCKEGIWDPPISHCYKLCPPLKSLTLDLQCWRGPDLVNCQQRLPPNSTATYQCKEHYQASYTNQPSGIRCDVDGTWSRELPRCTPKCGLSNLHSFESTPVIINGNTSEPGNFPWQAALYHKRSNRWQAVCGGTLISSNAVLTAAHCITVSCRNCKSKVMAKGDVMVGLGKNYRDWYTKEQSEAKRAVKEIRAHPSYVGSSLKYIADIAVLILEDDVEINNFIMPACVDFSKKHVNELTLDKEGYAAGWGQTEECTSSGSVCNFSSDELQYTTTTIIDFEKCYNIIQSIKNSSLADLTPDKFCSGNGTESVVQGGDSGGGLTFIFDGVHYVYGIVSVKLKQETTVKILYNFGVFTRVASYLDWLSDNLI